MSVMIGGFGVCGLLGAEMFGGDLALVLAICSLVHYSLGICLVSCSGCVGYAHFDMSTPKTDCHFLINEQLDTFTVCLTIISGPILIGNNQCLQ